MTLIYLLVAAGLLFSSVQALRVKSMLVAALWLAIASGMVSLLMYLLGSPGIAIIELSVGAGLVAVLFVFVIGLVGEDKAPKKPLFPKWLAILVSILSFGSLALLWGSDVSPILSTKAAAILADTIWEDRKIDIFLQAAFLITGVLSVLLLISPEIVKKVKGKSS